MSNDEIERLVGVDDVAEIIGVKKDTVRMWVRKGYMPAYKIGKLWKLKISDVNRWVDSQASIKIDIYEEPENEEPEETTSKNPC